jgi:predicted HicB family RNase H-like nuclease
MMEKSKNKMKTLKYKGYLGSVEFSEEDNVLFGEILGIDGLVNYEGNTIQELTESFHEETHRDIANLAAEEGVSINAFVKRALCEAVKHSWVTPSSLVQGYGAEVPEPAMLMDPGSKAHYGAWDEFKLSVPHKDGKLAKELAERMGWDLSHER